MKEVYLTIDDAPSKDFLRKIRYLHQKNIPAVIFCIGKLMEKEQPAIIEAIQKGFIIGNHSYSHPKFSKISLAQAKVEIEKTENLVEQAYSKAGEQRTHKLFRFPYGNKGYQYAGLSKSKKQQLQVFLKEKGFYHAPCKGVTYSLYEKLAKDADTYWTYDFREYRLGEIDNVIEEWEHSKNKKSTSTEILLIHDHQDTYAQFFGIINELLKEKILFKTIN